jgi:hypothetical protein
LELAQIELTYKFSLKEKMFLKLLEEYNQVILGINEQLVEWDSRPDKLSRSKGKN